MEHRIQTSRGEIIVRDTHIFEIVVPAHEQLILSFHGEKQAFRVQSMLDEAKNTAIDGKRVLTPPENVV